jgi:hypothetical protein
MALYLEYEEEFIQDEFFGKHKAAAKWDMSLRQVELALALGLHGVDECLLGNVKFRGL